MFRTPLSLLRPSKSNGSARSNEEPPDLASTEQRGSMPSLSRWCTADSVSSEESFDDLPEPPSYDEVVNDSVYKPRKPVAVYHYESFHDAEDDQRWQLANSTLVEYGLQSSRIYVRD